MSAAREMRRLSNQLVQCLQLPACDADLITAIGEAVNRVRGRPVRLYAVPFPPDVANGVWIDREGHDVIAYEKHADLEHQVVIIGHEIWHMMQGHCGLLTDHGPMASRALTGDVARAQELVTAICMTDDARHTADQTMHVQTSIQFALRADGAAVHKEEDADRFGVRFATAVQAHMEEVRSMAGLEDNLAGRIHIFMAHRFRR
ncbi:hypothetical protein [Streptomyces sp. NPDC059378]|uniref:hypothetical protein n=1 Tax=Streptomyces sp. NPDC059378 TaxID=3346815 RepID=UPI0036CA77D9